MAETYFSTPKYSMKRNNQTSTKCYFEPQGILKDLSNETRDSSSFTLCKYAGKLDKLKLAERTYIQEKILKLWEVYNLCHAFPAHLKSLNIPIPSRKAPLKSHCYAISHYPLH